MIQDGYKDSQFMKQILTSALIALTIVPMLHGIEIVDDFSGQDWSQSSTTPGTFTMAAGRLHLEDAEGSPEWVTASKTLTVNLDQTPWFMTNVTDLSNCGTVKLIRLEPRDKRVALTIDRPGLYALDMKQTFGWQGQCRIEVCLYAAGEQENITYSYVRFAENLSEQDQVLIRERKTVPPLNLKLDPFTVIPLFRSCSYYFTSPPRETPAVEFRSGDGTWTRALTPPYFPENGMYRGSIVDLAEDTSYEIRIMDGDGTILARQEFHTWTSAIPVGRTIVLDENTFTGHLTVRESGTPDAWLRYTARDGFVLRNDRDGPLLELNHVKYVVLDGLVLRGGLKQAIAIQNCEFVRVLNCDIAGWGRIGTQRFDIDGKFYTESGTPINWDSAVLVRRSHGTVIERCYIHDPVNAANSWYYSHPAGPQAVGIDKPTSTVLRYNDFIGSDLHRWNDAVEGAGNFQVEGGFNRDADIYGNLMCFANDDAIEIDGGQINVRVFDNKFEGCLCGVSIQGCMSSPSYVFRNLLTNMGDENGVAGQTIKTSSYANGADAVSFIINNTSFGESSDLNLINNLKIVAMNNIFAGRKAITGRERSPQSECDYNLLLHGKDGEEAHGVLGDPRFINPEAGLFALNETSPAIARGTAVPNVVPAVNGTVDLGAIPFASEKVLPIRPIPVTLDRYQLQFSPEDLAAGGSLTVVARVNNAQGFSSAFRVTRNDAFDWFEVTPAEGVLHAGEELAFKVTLRPERMTARSLYRGAFLIRLMNGFSRPVMVYADTGRLPPIKPDTGNAFAAYLEAEQPDAGTNYPVNADARASGGNYILLADSAGAGPAEYRFRIPREGAYFILMRIRSETPVGSHDSVRFALDDAPLLDAHLRSSTEWNWSLASHNRNNPLSRLQMFKMAPGEHTIRLAPRESIDLDAIVVTDDPGAFD